MARNPIRTVVNKIEEAHENRVISTLNKFGFPPFGRSTKNRQHKTEPPYARQVDPRWLKNVSNNQSLVNNSIESKVQQTFRRGFTEFEKKWEAKCPECFETYQSLEPFKLTEDVEDKDVDLDTDRPCPECGRMVQMVTPNPDTKEVAKSFFERANMRGKDENLAPDRHASISQSYREVCEEVARDIQTFDDGWMIFERSYVLDEDGEVFDWELEDVHRAPAFLMRYSTDDETGKIGGEYWVCLECRARSPDEYSPETKPGYCEECGQETYEVFAYLQDGIRGSPVEFYVRGEFAHGSEYQPRFLYGYSPILSVWQEARTLENMDQWYQEAYEQRRAPRGAIVVSSSNADSVRSWNTEQMEKLNADPNHIATFIDDSENGGKPLDWVNLLEEPAEMQHMQMREWFLDRIASKFGVTQVFQKAGAESTGMSQSLEIVVANRSMERLKRVFDETFIPALLGQVKAEGWERRVSPPEPEDEQADAQLVGRHLNNLQVAQQLGLQGDWTDEDSADIKSGPIKEAEEGDGGGGLGDLMGGGGGGDDPGGGTTPSGGRPNEPNEQGGGPRTPQDPSSDEPYNRSDSSVSSDSSGYSNTSYSGANEPEVIDYLEQVREQIASDSYNSDEERQKAMESALAKYDDAEFGPEVDQLREAAQRPNKNFQSARRMYQGDWAQDYGKNYAVQLVYEILTYE